eukprot:tig00000194_g14820.t1
MGKVLLWDAKAVQDWFATTFGLTSEDPAFQVICRLPLNGTLLLMRPARAMHHQLLDKLPHVVPDKESSRHLDAVHTLETVKETLDEMVAMLADDAKAACGEDWARKKIESLGAARAKATRQG